MRDRYERGTMEMAFKYCLYMFTNFLFITTSGVVGGKEAKGLLNIYLLV